MMIFPLTSPKSNASSAVGPFSLTIPSGSLSPTLIGDADSNVAAVACAALAAWVMIPAIVQRVRFRSLAFVCSQNSELEASEDRDNVLLLRW